MSSYNGLAMATTEDRDAVDSPSGSLGGWRERFDATPERGEELTSTISGVEVEPLYTAENAAPDEERLGSAG